jgi:hypothetical protein
MAQPAYISHYPAFRLILLIVAIVCFIVFALVSAGTVTTSHVNVWLGAGLAAFAASFI